MIRKLIRWIYDLFNGPMKPRELNWLSHLPAGFAVAGVLTLLGLPGVLISIHYGLLREILEENGILGELRIGDDIAWLDHALDAFFWAAGAMLVGLV